MVKRKLLVKESYKRLEDGKWTSKNEFTYHRELRNAGYDVDDLKKRGLCVHHIDGNAANNSLDNLQIMTYKEHAELHENGAFYRRYDILYVPTSKVYSVLEFEKEFKLEWVAQSIHDKIKGRKDVKGTGKKHPPRKNISQLTLYKESLLDSCIIWGRPEKKALWVGKNVNYSPIQREV